MKQEILKVRKNILSKIFPRTFAIPPYLYLYLYLRAPNAPTMLYGLPKAYNISVQFNFLPDSTTPAAGLATTSWWLAARGIPLLPQRPCHWQPSPGARAPWCPRTLAATGSVQSTRCQTGSYSWQDWHPGTKCLSWPPTCRGGRRSRTETSTGQMYKPRCSADPGFTVCLIRRPDYRKSERQWKRGKDRVHETTGLEDSLTGIRWFEIRA